MEIHFRLAEAPSVFQNLDLKHWKQGPTVYQRLRGLGATEELAAQAAADGCGRWWRRSQYSSLHKVLTVSYFDSVGVPTLLTSTS
jgi:RNA-directed DNA polymerase